MILKNPLVGKGGRVLDLKDYLFFKMEYTVACYKSSKLLPVYSSWEEEYVQ
jgi:hypothetical protein